MQNHIEEADVSMISPQMRRKRINTVDEDHCICRIRSTCGEGPVWSAEEGVLYWIDQVDSAIHRFDPTTGLDETRTLDAGLGAIALRADGGMVVAYNANLALLDPLTGAIERLPGIVPDRTDTTFNDAKCDSAGRLWIGTYHEVRPARPVGGIFRFDPDHTLTRIESDIRSGNGLGWSPDSRVFYMTDTQARTILAFDFDAADGELSNRRIFVETEQRYPDDRPDGLTVDAEGYIWSAHWAGWRVTRYAPDGTIDRELAMPVSAASSCAFGGANLDTLFITTPSEGLTADELAEQPLAGRLFAVDVGVKGLPEPRFSA